MLNVDEIRRHLQYMVIARVEDATGLSRYRLERIARHGDDVRVGEIWTLSAFLKGLRDDG